MIKLSDPFPSDYIHMQFFPILVQLQMANNYANRPS